MAVLESWAVIARQKTAPLLSPNTESRLNDEIKTKTLEINRRLNKIRDLENKIMLLEQELDKEAERLENSEKLIRVYEHQIRHNKKMADQGLHEAIMGLPAARPEEWSSEDVPEYLKEEIYHELHETLCDADDGSDITEDPRYE